MVVLPSSQLRHFHHFMTKGEGSRCRSRLMSPTDQRISVMVMGGLVLLNFTLWMQSRNENECKKCSCIQFISFQFIQVYYFENNLIHFKNRVETSKIKFCIESNIHVIVLSFRLWLRNWSNFCGCSKISFVMQCTFEMQLFSFSLFGVLSDRHPPKAFFLCKNVFNPCQRYLYLMDCLRECISLPLKKKRKKLKIPI